MAYIIISWSLLLALLILRMAVGRLKTPQNIKITLAQSMGKRQIQADVFDWSVRRGDRLLIIADGIGSGTRGRTAALAATDCLIRTFDLPGMRANPAYFFRQAFRNANDAVLRYVPDGTAGANVLSVLIQQGMLYYALAGNCRVSVFRNKHLIPLSEGQTLGVLAKDAFKSRQICRADARSVYHERRVYNYVGKDDFRDLEMFDIPVALKKGDIILLMTDGVYDFCRQPDLENILKTQKSCEKKAQAIIKLAEKNDDPTTDNATVVLARINSL